ncbi:MAG: cation-translocating P-type ATPase C-terminal domain-containing protein, partial [Planifilum fimeticola]
VMAQLVYVFDCRSSKSIFHRNPLENRSLVLAVLSSVLILFIIIYCAPLQPIFHTTAIGSREWMLIIAASTLPFLLAGGVDAVRGMRQAERK